MSDAWRAELEAGMDSLGLDPEPAVIERLLAYHALLAKWNRAYNLTSVREPDAMIGRHLLDSLSIHPYVEADELLDVGTGAGLPGLVLALARPDLDVTLLDSNGKKTRFLTQVKLELGLANVAVVHRRLEDWAPGRRFARISSRAFASLAEMVAKSAHLLAPGGSFLAMKGRYPADELGALPEGVVCRAVHSLNPAGSPGERHLVELSVRAE